MEMTYRIVAVTGFLLCAGSGWALYVRGWLRGGNAALSLALLGLSAMAVFPAQRVALTPVASYPDPRPLMVSTDGPVFGAYDLQTYHAWTGCPVIADRTIRETWATAASARARGKLPCPMCLGHEQPDGQRAAHKAKLKDY